MAMSAQTTEIIEKVKGDRKDFGIFFTPDWVVDFMIGLIEDEGLEFDNLRILEPAAGGCQFLYGVKKNRRDIFTKAIRKVGVEVNREIVNHLHASGEITIVHHDYLLWNTEERYDLIVGNPPYGIPSLSDHYTIKIDSKTKEKYKKVFETWHGKYNVYGAFIEKSIKLLKDNGQLLFIVPATFMILDEFKKLRKFLSENGKTEIIYMGSEVFKPEADVTTVVLKFRKSREEKNKLKLYEYREGSLELVLKNDSWRGEIVLLSSEFSREVDRVCSFRLRDIYEVRISPRTPEIRNSPYVIKSEDRDLKGLLPILNGRNLKVGKVIYEPLTGYWIKPEHKTKLRKFFDRPHIVVGLGFRGDGQIGSAYDYRVYPWMGDVYHLLRKNTLLNANFDLTEREVVEFLNSEIIKRYVKDIFREITYHLSITQLSVLPMPTREELYKLKETLTW